MMDIVRYVRDAFPEYEVLESPVNHDAMVLIVHSEDGAKTAAFSISGMEVMQNSSEAQLLELLSSRVAATKIQLTK